MARIESHMSGDDLRNNYEFKVVRRVLIREYPWIKDVTFYEDELDVYNIIFLNLTIDPIEMGETYGHDMNSWVKTAIGRGEKYKGTYPSLILNISYLDGQDEITKPINDTISQVHKSPALPEDLRLPRGRMFQVGNYIVNPEGEEW